ncbi:hypothetical protein PR202_gb26586 [Eleusine coracana subsp. coracana]|uniref:SIAH-type domain-containing protein n=1 Tax=Eleusine coracana subsp. coracana TaxID=191504 RepID=A0AAV5FS84_ELECO|nr:hypothetical protein PR202_gb26586 [Eleusine coracana subsp. coracana]
MDHAVESILIDCCNADHGCQERITYYNKKSHEKACQHAPCSCPYDSNCGFAVRPTELLEHLTGHHKCPCTEFKYWVRFDVHVKPGLHVLRCKNDGQLIHVHTQPVEQPRGYAVYIICVPPYDIEMGMGCSVSFNCSDQYVTSTKDNIRFSVTDCAPTPIDYLCFVPMVSDRSDQKKKKKKSFFVSTSFEP